MKTIQVLDYGYVKYLDHMGDDGTIAMDARTSYDRRTPGEDRALLRRLMRDRHTSPFEMGELKVEMKMPIFVARQIVRHRTANMNEISARYTELPDEMYCPETFYTQSKDNKQGRTEALLSSLQLRCTALVMAANDRAYKTYKSLLGDDVSREIARGVLPLNAYTKFVWKMDLHNLFHFLQLRLDPHAQHECRVYAEALWVMVQEQFPMCAEAFEDYRLHGVSLSRYEKELVTFLMHSPSPFHINLPVLKDRYVESGLMTESEWKNFVTKFQP